MTTGTAESPEPTFTRSISRRSLLTGAAAGAAGILTLPTAAAATASSRADSRPDPIGQWFEEMMAAITADPMAGLPERTWAMTWAAAWAALGSGRTAPIPLPQPLVFEDAAVATAAHGVLKVLVSSQAAKLDSALANTLAGLPDGPAKQAGITSGRRSAAATVRARTNDGLDLASVNAPFTLPPKAPGIYRLTPGATQLVGAGYGRARPFLLGRGDRFRPGPPPALGTPIYRRDWTELLHLGGRVSERTEEQNDLAWLDPMTQYLPIIRLLIGQSTRPRRSKVRLLAALGACIVDGSIAVFDAKYHYLHWRPVTAIRQADTDRDPRTTADPTWASFLQTPPHPEYPSGHTVTAGAAEQVLTHLVGPCTPMAFSVTYKRGDGKVVDRHYQPGTRWTTLTRENVDARVLAGVHFRFSDDVGATLGREIAQYNLRRLAPDSVDL